MKIIRLAILSFFSAALCAFSGEIPQNKPAFYADQTQALTYTNAAGKSMNYRLFLPKDYDAAKPTPDAAKPH